MTSNPNFWHLSPCEASANAEGWNGSVASSSSNHFMVELVQDSPRICFQSPNGSWLWWLLIESIFPALAIFFITILQWNGRFSNSSDPEATRKSLFFSAFFQPQKRSLQFSALVVFFLPPALVVRSNWHGQSAARMPPPRPRVLVDARQKFVHLLRSRKLRKRSEGQPGKHAGNLAWRNHFKKYKSSN